MIRCEWELEFLVRYENVHILDAEFQKIHVSNPSIIHSAFILIRESAFWANSVAITRARFRNLDGFTLSICISTIKICFSMPFTPCPLSNTPSFTAARHGGSDANETDSLDNYVILSICISDMSFSYCVRSASPSFVHLSVRILFQPLKLAFFVALFHL